MRTALAAHSFLLKTMRKYAGMRLFLNFFKCYNFNLAWDNAWDKARDKARDKANQGTCFADDNDNDIKSI